MVDPPPSSSAAALSPLAADQDRDRAVDALSTACADGRLSLEDFSQRLERALSARTMSDLVAVTADLRGQSVQLTPSPSGVGGSSWFVAIMASTVRRGRWHLRPSSQAVVVMGDCLLDLRQAEVEARSSHILAVALMGSVKIIVPEGIAVDITGAAIMGSKELRGGSLRPLPGSPLIRVTCIAVMGEVRVKVAPAPDDTGELPLAIHGARRPYARHRRHRRRHSDEEN